MQRWEIQGTGQDLVQLEAFVTERPGELYVEFTVDCAVVGSAVFGATRFDGGKMRFKGDGYYDPYGTITLPRISLEALFGSDGRELDITITEFAECRLRWASRASSSVCASHCLRSWTIGLKSATTASRAGGSTGDEFEMHAVPSNWISATADSKTL
jgi:hypothetical protein